MTSQLEALLSRARGPLGPKVGVDFGERSGPLAELGGVLATMNGFFLFNAGVQVFYGGNDGMGYDITTWNASKTWKYTYQGLADELFCFGQDVLGTQFAILERTSVVRFDPETAEITTIGSSLEDWAAWLLVDPPVNTTSGLAMAWQDRHGALKPDERLIPKQLLILGGQLTLDNLVVKDAVECMRIRGPIAHQIHDLPDGAEVRIEFD
jgi:hypothetical protein